MSERKPWSIRLDDRERSTVDTALKQVADNERFTGRDANRSALIHVCEKALLGFPSEATPATIARLQSRVACNFLHDELGLFYCLEGMGRRSKKKVELGDDPGVVSELCAACQLSKKIDAELWENREARKDSIRKVLELRKLFMKIATDGFQATVCLCIANVSKNGGFYISRDGETLPCTLSEGKPVKIDQVCRLAINPVDGTPPCRYFVEQEHNVRPDIRKEAQALNLPALTADPIKSNEDDPDE